MPDITITYQTTDGVDVLAALESNQQGFIVKGWASLLPGNYATLTQVQKGKEQLRAMLAVMVREYRRNKQTVELVVTDPPLT